MSDNLTITVLIPAWNEADTIAASIQSLYRQSRQPDRIVVVPNNTTDQTSVVAFTAGAEVLVMPGKNEKKKSGALNFAMDSMANRFDEQGNAALLVMDADTLLESDFIEKAEIKMLEDEFIGGVSSIFEGRDSKKMLGILQQLEFARYGNIVRRKAEVFVLSGTASLIRWETLKAIKNARLEGKKLPAGEGYYDVSSMTEDNELTLAILVMGYSVPHCGVISVTDVMEDYKSLFHQRKRWYLGALENIKAYGLMMPHWMRTIYWFQQIGLYIAMALTPLLWLSFYLSLVTFGLTGFLNDPLFIYTAILFLMYIAIQVITVWRVGWRGRLVALLYFPEVVYSVMLIIFYASALSDFLHGKKIKWIQT